MEEREAEGPRAESAKSSFLLEEAKPGTRAPQTKVPGPKQATKSEEESRGGAPAKSSPTETKSLPKPGHEKENLGGFEDFL